jgi:hypothetical protein
MAPMQWIVSCREIFLFFTALKLKHFDWFFRLQLVFNDLVEDDVQKRVYLRFDIVFVVVQESEISNWL